MQAHNTALNKYDNWFAEDIQKIHFSLLVMKMAHILAWDCFKVLQTWIQNYGNILVRVSWCLCSILYRFWLHTCHFLLRFQFQDMDYDFSEYCDDHLSKTFNPFTCELQPLVVSKVNRFNFWCAKVPGSLFLYVLYMTLWACEKIHSKRCCVWYLSPLP